MSTLGFRIPEDLQERLTTITEATHRTKSQIAKMAIETYLEKIEFFIEADRRYKDPDDEVVSNEQFKKDFNMYLEVIYIDFKNIRREYQNKIIDKIDKLETNPLMDKQL